MQQSAIASGRPTMLPQEIRRIILQQSKRANVGHIGSSLSIVEILLALYEHVLKVKDPADPDRDRFILSKGHAALALYGILFLKGWISAAELDTFCSDGSFLGVHPERAVPGIDFSTGSLGQGLSMGAGAALAARLQRSSRKTVVLISDAECNEGSVWEAVMFAAQHQLSNLLAIVDVNGQQALDYTERILDLSPMQQRWQAFGWDAREVDGHNVEQMAATLNQLRLDSGPPHVLIAKTVFGKGVSFMQGKVKWHYWPMSEDEYRQALQEVAGL